MNVAVVVPTIRQECLELFKTAWEPYFKQHDVELVVVEDGENPKVNGQSVAELMGDNADLIFNFNDGVRNAGFYYVAKHSKADVVITLDDDTKPNGDTIKQHLDVLGARVPISWMSTADSYMRGFPYSVRGEAEVMLSHGVWEGVKDWDAPTQLVLGNRPARFYRGVIPKGVLFPMCGMNIAFKRELLPYVYFAPMGHRVGLDRFADIWLGINLKRKVDELGGAVVTGLASVIHERASNVWKNLQKEAKGLELNETYWQGDESDNYFKTYNECRKRWEDLINDTN